MYFRYPVSYIARVDLNVHMHRLITAARRHSGRVELAFESRTLLLLLLLQLLPRSHSVSSVSLERFYACGRQPRDAPHITFVPYFLIPGLPAKYAAWSVFESSEFPGSSSAPWVFAVHSPARAPSLQLHVALLQNCSSPEVSACFATVHAIHVTHPALP